MKSTIVDSLKFNIYNKQDVYVVLFGFNFIQLKMINSLINHYCFLDHDEEFESNIIGIKLLPIYESMTKLIDHLMD